jgi:death on curing protein
VSDEEVEVRYLDLDDLYDIIRFATDLEPAVRDLGLLDSALHRPMASAFGQDAYSTLAAKAAALLESLLRNHALIDGNKRTAWVACQFFLRLNRTRLAIDDAGDGPAYDLIIGIAEGRLELDEIAAALGSWSRPA